jgi:hypothetical protein
VLREVVVAQEASYLSRRLNHRLVRASIRLPSDDCCRARS